MIRGTDDTWDILGNVLGIDDQDRVYGGTSEWLARMTPDGRLDWDTDISGIVEDGTGPLPGSVTSNGEVLVAVESPDGLQVIALTPDRSPRRCLGTPLRSGTPLHPGFPWPLRGSYGQSRLPTADLRAPRPIRGPHGRSGGPTADQGPTSDQGFPWPIDRGKPQRFLIALDTDVRLRERLTLTDHDAKLRRLAAPAFRSFPTASTGFPWPIGRGNPEMTMDPWSFRA